MNAEYRPGECNIGRPERRVRYSFAGLSFLVAAAMGVGVLAFDLPAWVALLTALPLFGGVISFLQARQGFCVGYAVQGVANVAGPLGEVEAIEDQEAVAADRRRAAWMTGTAAVVASLLAGGFFVLASL